MMTYTPLYEALANTRLTGWLQTLPTAVSAALAPHSHGKLPQWQAAIAALPPRRPTNVDLVSGVRVGATSDLDTAAQEGLTAVLQQLHPWRKGPFHLYGIHLDSEWRSDWKWERVATAVGSLNGRFILDIGSGNGYYGWRMVGAGARLVVGLDPYLLYVMQYHAIQRLLGEQPNYVLPLGIEALPPCSHAFDTVFSMGVLYHRRDPFAHLQTARDALRPGGQLVLETLVIDGAAGDLLRPQGRYAQMRNVSAIPSVPTLTAWLRQAGLVQVQCHDVAPTTVAEQRPTAWMTFQSLPHFLDPNDPSRTIEGYPAPQRALLTAVSP